MLLLSKNTFEKCRIIWKTRENRISLTRWKKKKKIEFCRCRNRCLFDYNQFQPFSQSNREGVSSSLTNAKNYTFPSFFLSISNISNCCELADFKHLSTFLVFNNPQKEIYETKHALQIGLRLRSFRWIWSKSSFLKSQPRKNDDCFRFTRNSCFPFLYCSFTC